MYTKFVGLKINLNVLCIEIFVFFPKKENRVIASSADLLYSLKKFFKLENSEGMVITLISITFTLITALLTTQYAADECKI